MPTKRGAATLALCALLTACAGDETQPRERPEARNAVETAPETGAAPAPEARPPEVQDTIWLEGMPEPVTLRLFEAPADFPLPFSVYVPGDMAAERVDAGDVAGAAVRFVAEFGGRRNPDAFVHVYAYPENTPVEVALGTARALIESRGVPVSQGLEPMEPRPALGEWTTAGEGFRLQIADDRWIIGDIAVGRHDGRLFHVVTHYPEEYAEGFVPRADAILESWVWTDSGERLGGGRVEG